MTRLCLSQTSWRLSCKPHCFSHCLSNAQYRHCRPYRASPALLHVEEANTALWCSSARQARHEHLKKQTPHRQSWQCSSTTSSADSRVQPHPGIINRPWKDTPEEKAALQALQKRLQAVNLSPAPDQATQIWFLRDRSLDVEETVQKLTAMTKWRQQTCPSGLTEAAVAAEAATGKAFLHNGQDNYGRPVVVIRAALHRTGEWPFDGSQRLCAFMIESALRQLPDGRESMLGIFDLRGFGLANADFGFFYFMIDAFFTYYPKRCSQVLLVDAPFAFKPIWSAVKPALGKYSALVSFISVRDLCPQYFSQQTLPEVFK